MACRTEPYPDQAGLYMRGDGNGFNSISAIIPEIVFYEVNYFKG